VAEEVEGLPGSKLKTLSSNPSTSKKRKKRVQLSGERLPSKWKKKKKLVVFKNLEC
jgi:hypothetical protein